MPYRGRTGFCLFYAQLLLTLLPILVSNTYLILFFICPHRYQVEKKNVIKQRLFANVGMVAFFKKRIFKKGITIYRGT